jgi:recombination protein RecA
MGSRSSAVRLQVESALAPRIPSALTLRPRPPAQTLATGLEAVDALTGGIPRGALTELYGPPCSGRTSVLLALLAAATGREESCALVDAGDALHPASAAAAGADLARLLWVRCGVHTSRSSARPADARLEQALKATDLLLQSGGFGLIVVDLGDLPPPVARRVPLASWFRFRRAVEETPTALVVLEQEPHARTCAALVLRLEARHPLWSEAAGAGPPHARLLRGLEVAVEVTRRRAAGPAGRKPPAPAPPTFLTRTAWG